MIEIVDPRWPGRLTRQQAPLFLTDQGFPIKRRQFEKEALPSAADPPEIDGWFGGRALYTQKALLAWAERRFSKTRRFRTGFKPKCKTETPTSPALPPERRKRGRPRKSPLPISATDAA